MSFRLILSNHSSTGYYLETGIDMRLTKEDIIDIGNIDIIEAISSGLIEKYVTLMLDGFMSHVSDDWDIQGMKSSNLTDCTHHSNESLLYYVLWKVSSLENWNKSFAVADKIKSDGDLLNESGEEDDAKVIQALQKVGMRANTIK